MSSKQGNDGNDVNYGGASMEQVRNEQQRLNQAMQAKVQNVVEVGLICSLTLTQLYRYLTFSFFFISCYTPVFFGKTHCKKESNKNKKEKAMNVEAGVPTIEDIRSKIKEIFAGENANLPARCVVAVLAADGALIIGADESGGREWYPTMQEFIDDIPNMSATMQSQLLDLQTQIAYLKSIQERSVEMLTSPQSIHLRSHIQSNIERNPDRRRGQDGAQYGEFALWGLTREERRAFNIRGNAAKPSGSYNSGISCRLSVGDGVIHIGKMQQLLETICTNFRKFIQQVGAQVGEPLKLNVMFALPIGSFTQESLKRKRASNTVDLTKS